MGVRQAVQLYNTYLHKHVGPYATRASTALSPYASTFNQRVYAPYILPAVSQFLPAAVTETPKSFMAMIADMLPGPGSHNVAESKGRDDFYANLEKAKRPADVPIQTVSKAKSTSSASTKDAKENAKADRAEMERVREAIKVRVEKQGKQGTKDVKSKVN